VFRVLTLPGSPRETALVYRNHGIQFHYLLYWNDVFASPGIIGTKVKLRFDPFDISHIYVYVHNHWVECITSSYYGQLHGHSEREIMLASAELREQNRESHVRTPIDAKRLADFLAKIEAYEAVLLQPLFILRTNQIGGSSLAGIESPRSAMLNVRFGEQSQVERAIRRDFAASPTQVATSAQCHTLDGTGK
jgi:hypothetical protein